MLEGIRLKLRHYEVQPFSALEVLDCKEREERFTCGVSNKVRFYITILETNQKLHEWAIEPWAGDNIFEIVDKLEKESCIRAVIITDYKKHVHYWREF